MSSVEPTLVDYGMTMRFETEQPWYEARLRVLEEKSRKVLGDLSARLGDAEWIDGAFSAGDLMLAGVLFRAKGTGILDHFPNVAAYVARAEARPAFQRAFAAQLAVFESQALS